MTIHLGREKSFPSDRIVIPIEAEGSAVSLPQQPLPMEASPSPLSSRAKSRDLQFHSPSNHSPWKLRLLFVIPSEAEGSAVSLPQQPLPMQASPPLCHPERSRGTCGSADLSWEFFFKRGAAGAVPLPCTRLGTSEGYLIHNLQIEALQCRHMRGGIGEQTNLADVQIGKYLPA